MSNASSRSSGDVTPFLESDRFSLAVSWPRGGETTRGARQTLSYAYDRVRFGRGCSFSFFDAVFRVF
jgi:hypothetical protein